MPIVYTGVAGHEYEPANFQQAHREAVENFREGAANPQISGFFRNSWHAYGHENSQRWGWGHNQPYHYGAPSHHDSNDNHRSIHHKTHKSYHKDHHYENKKHNEHQKHDGHLMQDHNKHDWRHSHFWKHNDWQRHDVGPRRQWSFSFRGFR